MNVGIINYGMGNIGSVAKAVSMLGANPIVLEEPADMERADKVILPGVGAFSAAMENLRAGGWVEAIDIHVRRNARPFLGICLGMQLLADESEEGGHTRGLGLVPGRVVSLQKVGCNERVPHVGWNEVRPSRSSRIFNGIPVGTDFYFVHSFVFEPDEADDIAATSSYGRDFTAAVEHGHVAGAQFHPERSSKAGARLLKNFLD